MHLYWIFCSWVPWCSYKQGIDWGWKWKRKKRLLFSSPTATSHTFTPDPACFPLWSKCSPNTDKAFKSKQVTLFLGPTCIQIKCYFQEKTTLANLFWSQSESVSNKWRDPVWFSVKPAAKTQLYVILSQPTLCSSDCCFAVCILNDGSHIPWVDKYWSRSWFRSWAEFIYIKLFSSHQGQWRQKGRRVVKNKWGSICYKWQIISTNNSLLSVMI